MYMTPIAFDVDIIGQVTELDALPKLQRLFLSNNKIHTFQECRCIFSVE